MRDGASATTFLQNLQASANTLMAMETFDGEVFGAFTLLAWTSQPYFFGVKDDCFLWQMKHLRAEQASLVSEQAKQETNLDIFPNILQNPFAQIYCQDKIGAGRGGTPLGPTRVATGAVMQPNQFGFRIGFDRDYLLEASSSASMTFKSLLLSKLHSDGSKFELINLEVWAFTLCITLEET